MLKNKYIFILLVLLSVLRLSNAQDSLQFRGQISAWGNFSSGNELPVWFGGRIIPQANYETMLSSQKIIDFELSANINGGAGFLPFDTVSADGNIKAYRAWARFYGRQFEVRAGLQKINFGSATMLRPLMWFDQMDPRDPLQLTDGVWGVLGRYYFLNNANIWLWALYGNTGLRAWELFETAKRHPEFGLRVQVPLLPGELAFSYHNRQSVLPSELFSTSGLSLGKENYPEHRFALDGKWDVGPGVWFEAVWLHNTRKLAQFTNHEMLNIGADYTFGLGNGLNMVIEHLFLSFSERALSFNDINSFSALSFNYPLGFNHQFSAIFYRDWSNDALYSFVNWRIQLQKINLYCMAFWNPENYHLPQQGANGQMFSGKGVQLMLVYNY